MNRFVTFLIGTCICLIVIFALFSQLSAECEELETSESVTLPLVYESTPVVVKNEEEIRFYSDLQYLEYSYACEVWDYLRKYGFNEYVSAGILGNMMTECGGQSLNLNPTIYDATGKYYGLCQWSLKYTPQVNGTDLDTQLDILISTLETNMSYFGGNLDYFSKLQDEVEAAKYFQNYYERGAGTFARSKNATYAYNYFHG